MALTTKCARFFHPSKHLWFRPIPVPSAASVRLEIGLTERGMEDIGDITSIQSMISTNGSTNIVKGQELLQIHYDGHSITSADELYHTVWETFSDKVSVHSPVAGEFMKTSDTTTITSQYQEYFIDDSTALVVNLVTTKEEWESASKEYLAGETLYLEAIQKLPRGTFAEQD
jgi:hypothetical protein